ncbi:hypothetical protein BJ138DRAFT_1158907 [Hygrophoropsis aurantiaca]|uniref:Uncharacterized protein n=1 Tax=Hygrophoropsis aurantiaca TaxID=72124 RepID=A0ACB8A3J8_9AGAM|nr:hypothetical protein BJ138DRAFT_1158907 [Hygrophoropsis aurantiaca]
MATADVLNPIQAANYVTMAASAAVVYDQLLTLPEEIDLIWRRRWSMTTFLYLVARYSGTLSVVLATAATAKLDWHYAGYAARFIIENWAVNIFATAMDGILLMRAYALCNRSRPILIFLLICFVAQTAVVVVITGMEINIPNTRRFVISLGDPVGSVMQDMEVDATVLVPSPIIVTAVQLVFNFIVFGFAMYAFSKHMKEARKISGGWKVSPLVRLLIDDQIIYFFCYVVWQGLDIPVYAPSLPQSQALNVIANALDALVIIAGPRMVISLRVQENKLTAGGGATYQTELSAMNFGARELPATQSTAYNELDEA